MESLNKKLQTLTWKGYNIPQV